MKLRKLILATAIALPSLGYCGLIDWATGYPEIKEKIEQKLEQKYHGDKFEVWDVSYSDNLGGYNFDYKPDNKKSDTKYSGSYFPKNDSVAANGYMWSSIGKQWRDMFTPYIEEVSNNYTTIGGMGSGVAGDGTESKALKKQYFNDMNDSLAYMFKTGSTEKWIKKDHNSVRGGIAIFMAVPRTAEGIYQTLDMIEKINNKLRSFGLFSYTLEVITYDLPTGFNIDNYFDEVKGDFHTSVDWWFVEGIQKYAWGYLKVRGCMPINAFEKACNNYKELDNPKKLDIELINTYTTADRLNNLQDIANQFRLVDEFGVPSKCEGMKCVVKWSVSDRARTQLKDSKYYVDLEKLINKGEK